MKESDRERHRSGSCRPCLLPVPPSHLFAARYSPVPASRTAAARAATRARPDMRMGLIWKTSGNEKTKKKREKWSSLFFCRLCFFFLFSTLKERTLSLSLLQPSLSLNLLFGCVIRTAGGEWKQSPTHSSRPLLSYAKAGREGGRE